MALEPVAGEAKAHLFTGIDRLEGPSLGAFVRAVKQLRTSRVTQLVDDEQVALRSFVPILSHYVGCDVRALCT